MHFRGILYGFFFLFVNKNIKILVIIVIPTHILFVSLECQLISVIYFSAITAYVIDF